MSVDRRIWAATESRAIGYGGDALVSDATVRIVAPDASRKGRGELESGGAVAQSNSAVRAPDRPGIKQSQFGHQASAGEVG